jgi:hypothetical protein
MIYRFLKDNSIWKEGRLCLNASQQTGVSKRLEDRESVNETNEVFVKTRDLLEQLRNEVELNVEDRDLEDKENLDLVNNEADTDESLFEIGDS